MSKFAEKLQRIYRGSASPIGFRKSTEVELPPMLIVANLTKASTIEAKAIAGSGIDGGIVSSEGLTAKGFGQLAKALADAPLGLFLESAESEVIAKSMDLGCDFVVFGLKTPFEVLNRQDLGKVLKIEPTLDQGLVRSINRLPLMVDGVLVTGEETVITVERLLIYQRFAELLDKPFVVTVSSSLTSGELSSLYEAGVSGLVLPDDFAVEAFAELKKIIGSLSKTAKPRTRPAALLPRLGGEPEVKVEELEEEEDIKAFCL
jgi:hypothetical protein